MAEAYYLYGKTFEAAADQAASHSYFFQITEASRAPWRFSRFVQALQKFSAIEMGPENYKETLNYTRKSVAMAKRVKAYSYLGKAYDNMAAIHNTDWSLNGKKPEMPRPRPDSVLHHYHKVESGAKQTNDSLQLAGIKGR